MFSLHPGHIFYYLLSTLFPLRLTQGFPRIIFFTALAIILFLTCSHAYAKPIVEIIKKHYYVQGKTAEEIRRNLNKNSTIVVRNKRFDAYTQWQISWNIWYSYQNNNCTISKISTQMQINHTMPELTSKVSSHLRRKWQKYYYALLDHERGHGDLGIEAAYEIERNISNLPPQSDCKILEKKAKRLGRKVIKKYVSLEKKYDRETRHGAARGALFP